MYIIVTEALPKDILYQSREFERDGIIWFEIPVIRYNTFGKRLDKKVIVRYISSTEFNENFQYDDKIHRRFIAESLMVTNYLKEKDGYLNA